MDAGALMRSLVRAMVWKVHCLILLSKTAEMHVCVSCALQPSIPYSAGGARSCSLLPNKVLPDMQCNFNQCDLVQQPVLSSPSEMTMQ
jgi:hypothetical protein